MEIPKSLDLKNAKIVSQPIQSKLNPLKISVIAERCIGCGQCADVCPFGLFEKNDKKYVVSAPERCIECSACKRNCPVNAIIMNEVVGCGCLWDVAKRKGPKNACC